MFKWKQCLSVSNRWFLIVFSFPNTFAWLFQIFTTCQVTVFAPATLQSSLHPTQIGIDGSPGIYFVLPLSVWNTLACQNPVQLVRPDCSLPAWSLPWLSTQKRTYNFAWEFFSHMGVYSQGYSTHRPWMMSIPLWEGECRAERLIQLPVRSDGRNI